jgi:hypothetical protein
VPPNGAAYRLLFDLPVSAVGSRILHATMEVPSMGSRTRWIVVWKVREMEGCPEAFLTVAPVGRSVRSKADKRNAKARIDLGPE